MTRCCLCRRPWRHIAFMEATDLPGTGYRCTDHVGCRARVRDIVAAHAEFAKICDSSDGPLPSA